MTETQQTGTQQTGTQQAGTIGSFADVDLDGAGDFAATAGSSDVADAIDTLAAANGYTTEQVVWVSAFVLPE